MARLRYMAKGALKIWWGQEGISEADLGRLASGTWADWIIPHTAPELFDDVDFQMRETGFYVPFVEPSRKMLDRVFEKYRPKRWFYGHFHHYMQGETQGCTWEALSNLDGGGKVSSWVFLEWED